MFRGIVFSLLLYTVVTSYPHLFQKRNFKIGIEYDHSLPMSGGSDRFRHRNNYDPFFVTVTATAKKGYVLSYLEVSATTDVNGEVSFELVRGQTGARNMVFQLVSNNSDFLSYNYMSYGIRDEEYKKVANIITFPVTNQATAPDFAYFILMLNIFFVNLFI